MLPFQSSLLLLPCGASKDCSVSVITAAPLPCEALEDCSHFGNRCCSSPMMCGIRGLPPVSVIAAAPLPCVVFEGCSRFGHRCCSSPMCGVRGLLPFRSSMLPLSHVWQLRIAPVPVIAVAPLTHAAFEDCSHFGCRWSSSPTCGVRGLLQFPVIAAAPLLMCGIQGLLLFRLLLLLSRVQ